MGTSGSFGGGQPMVPSWVGDPPTAPASPPSDPPPNGPDGQPDDGGTPPPSSQPPPPLTPYPPVGPRTPGTTYGPARADMTSGTRTSSGGRLRSGAGKFVAASGGGQAAAARMGSSRALAGGIAGLANAVSSVGATEALKRFNLEGLAGAPAEEVFVALTDSLCPPGGTIDEAIARDALLETVADLADKGVGNFDELTPDDLQEVFIGVVSRSIEGRIMNEVATNALKIAEDTKSVETAQKMLRGFIVGCVRDRFQASGESIASLDSRDIDRFVGDLYATSFDLMQTMGEVE